MTSPWVSRKRLYEQAERAQRLADELRLAKAQIEQLREAHTAAQKEARDAVRMVADWMAERQFGRKIFDVTPALGPDAPAVEALDRYNVQASQTRARDVVRRATERFNSQLRENNLSPLES